MIYVSSSCVKNNTIKESVEELAQEGYKNIEISGGTKYYDGYVNDLLDLKDNYNLNYLLHNYFPPPKIPFNFNLASQNKLIRKKSLDLAKKAIDLCRQIDSPLYTFHGGFTTDPKKLGVKFTREKIFPKSKSILTFIDSVFEIVDFAKSNGIKLAMEPNVVQKFNLIRNKNELLVFAELDEIEILFKFFKTFCRLVISSKLLILFIE